MLEPYLPYIFLLNSLLIIIDAALGYFVAPLLLARMGDEESRPAGWTTVSVRRLLAVVVAFYMFFNCLAYFGQKNILMVIVTGVVLFDIAFQLVVRRKVGKQ